MAQAAFLIVSTAIKVGGDMIAAGEISEHEKLRQTQLANEMKDAELAALDQENSRLLELEYANSDVNANAGGLDVYASPSIMALRKFNMKQGNKDIKAIYKNLQSQRANTSLLVKISNNRIRSSRRAAAVGMLGSVVDMTVGLNKTKTPKVEGE